MNDRASPRMERLIQAAELRDTGLIAGALAAYARRAALDDADLAALLRCDTAVLTRIKLCWLPRAEQWAGDLALIAHRFGCDATALGNALDQIAGDLVYLLFQAAAPELAERAAMIARARLGTLAVVDTSARLTAGGDGWVVYARLDLGSGGRKAAETASGGR